MRRRRLRRLVGGPVMDGEYKNNDEDYVNYMVALTIRNRTRKALVEAKKALKRDNELLAVARAGFFERQAEGDD